MFLQRLPRKLRILLLLHEDISDLKSLAAKADRLHSHRRDVVSVNVIAAVVQELSLEEDDGFAAVLQGQPSNKGGNSQNMEREPPSAVEVEVASRQPEVASRTTC